MHRLTRDERLRFALVDSSHFADKVLWPVLPEVIGGIILVYLLSPSDDPRGLYHDHFSWHANAEADRSARFHWASYFADELLKPTSIEFKKRYMALIYFKKMIFLKIVSSL